jgi:hypothetical protein
VRRVKSLRCLQEPVRSAKLARKAAAVSEEKFEADVAKSVAIAVASIEGNTAVIKAARAEQNRIRNGAQTFWL